MEESEADLDRFRSWMAKIEARDYFPTPQGDLVRAELTRAAETLTAFARQALAGEDADGAPPSR
ncbi:Chromate resistance protein ChrB [Streptomyces sp. 067-1]|uniref:Chromate resistance protein ChrB n=1 Tax=Streptomyces sp. 067-1 TaxID=2789269 RepID=UPI0039F53C91